MINGEYADLPASAAIMIELVPINQPGSVIFRISQNGPVELTPREVIHVLTEALASMVKRQQEESPE